MLFDTPTPLGFYVRCTGSHWEFIVNSKHPVLAGRAKDIEDTLRDPDQVRRSRKDPPYSFSIEADLHAGYVLSRRQNDSGF